MAPVHRLGVHELPRSGTENQLWTAMAYRGALSRRRCSRECPDSQLPSNNSCGLGFVEGDASALDFGEDFGALGLPLVGLWIGVARGEIRLDIVHQFL